MWSDSQAYDAYMGRWSRQIARRFLPWLDAPSGGRWLDVGCGTGVLSSEVLANCEPALVCGVDRSAGYVGAASRLALQGCLADATALPFAGDRFDYAISGLVINFVPEPVIAISEMRRVTRPGGTVAVYVWDYREGMELLRRFWQTAASLDETAAAFDEGSRFTICQPDQLEMAFTGAGLGSVAVEAMDTRAHFDGFDDYWQPFLNSQGPASAYIATLAPPQLEGLRQRLEETLPIAADGSLDLGLRAWAARGVK